MTDTKKNFRKYMLKMRSELDMLQRDVMCQRIEENLFLLDEYKNAAAVYVYIDYNGEVRTDKIIERALSDSKKVYVPRVYEDGMKFLSFRGFESLEVGYKGIKEPGDCKEDIDESREGLLIMPLLCADSEFNRTGYGKGFYDGYLGRRAHKHVCVGIAYDFQYVDRILDTNEFDRKLDMLVTDERVLINNRYKEERNGGR